MRYKPLLNILALVCLASTSLWYLWIFYQAYIDPTYTTTMAINYYGEANLEMFVLFPLTLFSIFYAAKLIYDHAGEVFINETH